MPQNDQFCLLSLPFQSPDGDMPVGVAVPRLDAAITEGGFLSNSIRRAYFHATQGRITLGRSPTRYPPSRERILVTLER